MRHKLGWWITADTELYVWAKRWWSWARLTDSPRTLHSFLKRKRSGVPFRAIPLRDWIIRPIPNCAIPLPAQGSRTLNSATKKRRHIVAVYICAVLIRTRALCEIYTQEEQKVFCILLIDIYAGYNWTYIYGAHHQNSVINLKTMSKVIIFCMLPFFATLYLCN